ncbi:hypothetical protein Q31b_44390 [Novipirellula aureliae]|uniref:O-Antigen ligase n=2 Tax=Novipirellula aureliae TaxID=2527966 RepID=A0A5C6DPS4_9BACT|nr:hypothetical protein Q31b_44390 [Novipirellula aureliae]
MFGVEQFFQTRSAIFLDRSSLVNLGVGIVTAFAAFCWLSRNEFRFNLDKTQAAAILLILFSQASRFWTIAPEEFAQYYGRAPLPYYVLYLLVAPILSQSKNGIRDGVQAAIYIGVPLVIVISFFVEWHVRGISLARPVMHHGSLKWFTPPLALADTASYIAIFCVILRPKNSLWKMVHLATFALACNIVFRTQSRGQLVSLAVVILTFYPIANQVSQARTYLLTLAGFIAGGLVLYLTFSFLGLGEVNRWNEVSMRRGFEGRAEMVMLLFKAWSESDFFHLLFGLGSAAGWKTSGFDVHNLSVEILGELGIIGFSIYLYICVQAFSNAIKIIGKLKHYPEMRREAVILIALFTYSCILSLKSVALFSTAPLMFFFAIALSQLEKHSREFTFERIRWKQLLSVT